MSHPNKKPYPDKQPYLRSIVPDADSEKWRPVLNELLGKYDNHPKKDYPAPKPGMLQLPEVLEMFLRHGLTGNSVIDRSNVVWLVANTGTTERKDDRNILTDDVIAIKIPLTALPGHGNVGPRAMAGDIVCIHAMRCAPMFRESTAEMLVYYYSAGGQNEIVVPHAYDWYVTMINFAICNTAKLESYMKYLIKLVSREDVADPSEYSALMEFSSSYSQWTTYDMDGINEAGFVYVPNTSNDVVCDRYKMPTIMQLDEIIQQYVKGYCDLDNCLRNMMTNPMVDTLRITCAQYEEIGRLKREQQDSFLSMMSDAVLNLGFADEIERSRNSLKMLTDVIDKEPENKDDNTAGQ